MLKISDTAHILPLMPHRVAAARKSNFVHDFANNAGSKSQNYRASRGLSAIAELLVLIAPWKQSVALVRSLTHSNSTDGSITATVNSYSTTEMTHHFHRHLITFSMKLRGVFGRRFNHHRKLDPDQSSESTCSIMHMTICLYNICI